MVAAEEMPFRWILQPLLGKIIVDLGGMTGSHGTQKERTVFTTTNSNIKVATIICWENEFGGQTDSNGAFRDNTDSSAHSVLSNKWASQAHSSHQHAFTVNGTTGQRQNQAWGVNDFRENRPDNVGVYWIIRYK